MHLLRKCIVMQQEFELEKLGPVVFRVMQCASGAIHVTSSSFSLSFEKCDPTELIDYEGFCGFAPKSPPTTTNASGPPLTSSSTLPWELVEQQQFTQISVKETVRYVLRCFSFIFVVTDRAALNFVFVL